MLSDMLLWGAVRRSASGAEELKQDGDGLYVRYLPAPLLKEVNIVDTPGTNVILQRQQRLTEEYVPRADLVLFTMSAGAPSALPIPNPASLCSTISNGVLQGY
jgi:Dynamin family